MQHGEISSFYCQSNSLDLRKRVVDYVKSGGSKIGASRLYQVSLWCVNDWSCRSTLEAKKPQGRPRKMDWSALEKDIQETPDKLLRERAVEFVVWPNAIWHACQVLKITHKKKLSLPGKKL